MSDYVIRHLSEWLTVNGGMRYHFSALRARQDTDKLLYAIEVLAIHGRLPEEYLAHCLSGNWKPKWECHIQPNFLLVYETTDYVLRLERCGSHSDLFE